MRIDMQAPLQLRESAWWIPIRSPRTGRVHELDADLMTRSGGLAGFVFLRPASRGHSLRGWTGYPVERFDPAMGGHIEVLGVDR